MFYAIQKEKKYRGKASALSTKQYSGKASAFSTKHDRQPVTVPRVILLALADFFSNIYFLD